MYFPYTPTRDIPGTDFNGLQLAKPRNFKQLVTTNGAGSQGLSTTSVQSSTQWASLSLEVLIHKPYPLTNSQIHVACVYDCTFMYTSVHNWPGSITWMEWSLMATSGLNFKDICIHTAPTVLQVTTHSLVIVIAMIIRSVVLNLE